ncbi:MAG: high-potential iron-sulfur protein [Pseudomonadota bacterium]
MQKKQTMPRREFVKLTGVALVPLLPLAGCGGDSGGGDAAATVDDVADTAESVVDDVVESVEDAGSNVEDAVTEALDDAEQMVDDAADQVNEAMSGDLPQLAEDDPQAVALGYKHDATAVSAERYEAGQKCQNCILYTGGDKPWGPCSIFPGRAVNANGWCSTYAPKAG